jgi:hypothetical protein
MVLMRKMVTSVDDHMEGMLAATLWKNGLAGVLAVSRMSWLPR